MKTGSNSTKNINCIELSKSELQLLDLPEREIKNKKLSTLNYCLYILNETLKKLN
jgi:hypothetical protein